MKRLIAVLVLLASGAVAEGDVYIAGTMPESGDYNDVLTALADVEAKGTTLTLFWDELTVNGVYIAEPDWPTIANAVYPDAGLSVGLVISVIDTTTDRRPPELQDVSWDDPRVVDAFVAFLNEIAMRMPDVDVTSVAIGNEVDGVLSGEDWRAYGRFLARAAQEARQIWPDALVGVTMTWSGLQMPQAQELSEVGDALMVNWYPLDNGFAVQNVRDTSNEIAQMRAMAGNRPLLLTEAGRPSGGCGGTPEDQAAFVETLLAEDLQSVTFVWLHDLSAEDVEGYGRYYGVTNPCFDGYLATLGLRTRDGRDKPAFEVLRNAASN